MPGANYPLDLVRLQSVGDTLAILGRFRPGFERPVAGGYAVAEEFVVLEGTLELEGGIVDQGTLCFIPAHHVRAPMRSPQGCTVLAWFSGPPQFHNAKDLAEPEIASVAMAQVREAPIEAVLLCTTEAVWRVDHPRRLVSSGLQADVVDLALTYWAHLDSDQPDLPPGPVLARIPLADRLAWQT